LKRNFLIPLHFYRSLDQKDHAAMADRLAPAFLDFRELFQEEIPGYEAEEEKVLRSLVGLKLSTVPVSWIGCWIDHLI